MYKRIPKKQIACWKRPKDQLRGWQRISWPPYGKFAGRKNSALSFPGVYCIWRGACLEYIGTSKDVGQRLNTHYKNNFGAIVHFVTHVTALRCKSEEMAAALEAELIQIHWPRMNIRREPRGGQVRKFNPKPRDTKIPSRYKIVSRW